MYPVSISFLLHRAKIVRVSRVMRTKSLFALFFTRSMIPTGCVHYPTTKRSTLIVPKSESELGQRLPAPPRKKIFLTTKHSTLIVPRVPI